MAGRPKQDGKPRKYIVPDDVHEFIKSQGGGEYLTLLMRGVMAINKLQEQGG